MAASISNEKTPESTTVNSAHDEYPKQMTADDSVPEKVSLRQALKGNGSVLWWSFFFALSAIGWFVPFPIEWL